MGNCFPPIFWARARGIAAGRSKKDIRDWGGNQLYQSFADSWKPTVPRHRFPAKSLHLSRNPSGMREALSALGA